MQKVEVIKRSLISIITSKRYHICCRYSCSSSSSKTKIAALTATELKQLHAHQLRTNNTGDFAAAAWDELIRAYCNHQDHEPPNYPIPFLLFKQMQSNGIRPTQFTFPPLLKCLAASVARREGTQVHSVAVRSGLVSNTFVSHSLIHLYSRYPHVVAARQLFEEMGVRNRVSWNVMLGSYCQNGLFNEALVLFRRMLDSGCGFDKVTLVSVLPACARLGAIGMGEWIHRMAKEGESALCVFVGTALVDMYCKCGFLEKAERVFDEMLEKNVVTWNAMIGGFSMHSRSDHAFELFERLRASAIRPNYVTFIGVLCACTHAGLVDKGLWYFECMRKDYSIEPAIQHYACIVDLLGRAGHLAKALELVEAMPISPDSVIWGALLGACKMHKNVELGERVMKHLVKLEPKSCGNYMILSNIYADAGRWDDAARVAMKMKKHGIKKTPGCSWIEVDFEIHQFLSGDRSHPLTERIYHKLEELRKKLTAVGYVPNIRSAFRNIEEEDKEDALGIHSEKLAIAFALISLELHHTIRIVKNLRMCSDCHAYMKFISKIVEREIIVRDNSRFHCFEEGSCSCMDYW